MTVADRASDLETSRFCSILEESFSLQPLPVPAYCGSRECFPASRWESLCQHKSCPCTIQSHPVASKEKMPCLWTGRMPQCSPATCLIWCQDQSLCGELQNISALQVRRQEGAMDLRCWERCTLPNLSEYCLWRSAPLGRNHTQSPKPAETTWDSAFRMSPQLLQYLRRQRVNTAVLYTGPFTISHIVLGLRGKVLVVGELQGWLLWDVARSFPCVWQSRCQPAPRQTHCWPRPSPSAPLW